MRVLGSLVGVGVGPGDPDLLTLRALHELRAADRVFVPATAASGDGLGRAERVVLAHVDDGRVERLRFAMTDEASRAGRWDAAGERIAAVIRAGGTAAFATLGDPNLYSTFAYVAQTVRAALPGLAVRTVPGITAMQDLAARSGTVLAEGTDRLALVPWTAGEAQVRAALDDFETVVVYKGGREQARVLRCLHDAGRIEDGVVGAQLGSGEEQVVPAAAAGGEAPYLSTVLVTGHRGEQRGGRL